MLWWRTSRVRTTISFARVIYVLYNVLYSVLMWLSVRRTRTRSARRCHVDFHCLYKQLMHSCIACLVISCRSSSAFAPLFSLHPDPEVWVPTTTTTTILHLATRQKRTQAVLFGRSFLQLIPALQQSGRNFLFFRSGQAILRLGPLQPIFTSVLATFTGSSSRHSASFLHTSSPLLRHASAMADAVFDSLNSFQSVGRKVTLLEARVKFGGVQQQLDQSVEEFASALRATAVDCKFGATLDTRLATNSSSA